MKDSKNALVEAEGHAKADKTPEEFKPLQTIKAMDVLKEMFETFGWVTEYGCVLIGDALLSLKAKLNAREYHRFLTRLRLTPVAAWDYESICRNALLREKLEHSERVAEPNELALLASLSDSRVRSILKTKTRNLSEQDRFVCKSIRQVRESVIMSAASQFGWPRIIIRPGEKWMVAVIPTKIGTQESFFVRVGLHGNGETSQICPRTTDAKLGGNSAAPCAACDEIEEESETEYRVPVPHWGLYCRVHYVANDDGELRSYFQDPSEPFVLIVDEPMFASIVSASLKRTYGSHTFSYIELDLDENEHLRCSSIEEPGFCGGSWQQTLQEPSELRVAARECAVYPLGAAFP